MKKIAVFCLAAVFALGTVPALAAPEGEKGASDQALANASERSVFNRTGDWFATVGKSDEEKKTIRAERQAKRDAKRAEKQAKKQKQEAEKKMKEAQGQADAKKKEAEKKAQKAGNEAKGKLKGLGK